MISESNELRLFVAVDIPEEHKTALLKAQKAFPGLPWISARQIHLTMRFIGEVDVDQFDRVTGCLNDVSASQFTLRPDGTGFFPDAAKPSIFWFGLQESAELLALKQKVDAVLKSAIGLTPEARHSNKMTGCGGARWGKGLAHRATSTAVCFGCLAWCAILCANSGCCVQRYGAHSMNDNDGVTHPADRSG